jgi:hypothetical protein
MARPGWPERTKAARSLGQFKRFRHVINSDKVLGTHRIVAIEFVHDFADLGAGQGGYNEDHEFYGYRMPI